MFVGIRVDMAHWNLHLSFQVEEKSLKSRYTNSSFSIRTEWVKKSILSFKRHLNYLSIDVKVYKK